MRRFVIVQAILLFSIIFLFSWKLNAQTISPHIGASYLTYNGSTRAGSPTAQINMYTGQSITVQINGANYGTSTAPSGGIDFQIWEITTQNNNQINLTGINSSSGASNSTYWAGSILGTGQTAQYLHIESAWNNWPGGGAYKSMNVTFTTLQPGTYHIYTKMYLSDGNGNYPRDPAGTTPNTDDQGESNYLIGTIIVSGYPDLVVQSPSLGSNSLQSGSSTNIVYNLHNSGNQQAGSFRVGIYLSTSQYSPQTLLTAQTINGLGVSSTVPENNIFTIPQNTPSGNYYIVVYVDDQNQITESNENNNTNGTPIAITQFTVTKVNANVTPTTLSSVGSSITTSGSFTGSGNGQISYTWEWQQPGSSSWTSMSGLTYHATMTNGSATDPSGTYNPFTKGGTYNLRIHITSPNDIASNSVAVNVPLPDLTVPTINLSLNSVQSGQSTTVNYTISNQIQSPAGSFRVGVYLGTSQYNTQTLLGSANIQSLSGGGSSTGSLSVTIPANTSSGNYFIVVYADDQNQVSESNENNNINGTPISITQITQFIVTKVNANVTPTTLSSVSSSITTSGSFTGSGNGQLSYTWEWQQPGSSSWTSMSGLTYHATMTNGSATDPPGTYNPFTKGGIYNLRIHVTSPNDIVSNSVAVNIPLPDIIIQSFTYSPTNPTTADNITFTAVIKNNSSVSCGAFVASLRVGGEINPQTYNISGLSAQGTYTITRVENLSVAQNYQAEVIADINNSVTESNESNNSATAIFTVTTGELTETVSVNLPKFSGNKGTQSMQAISVSDLSNLNIVAYQFSIYYDKNIVYITGADNSGTLSASNSPTVNADTANGKISVAWASANPLSGSGKLLNLNILFRNVGTSTLTTTGTSGQTFIFNSGNPIASISDGSATTSNIVKGDVDGNGIVQAIDASLILQNVVGLITLNSTQLAAADVNNDGTVGAYDASLILYYVVYGSWSSSSQAMAKVSSSQGSLVLGNLTKTGELYYLPLKAISTNGVNSLYAEIKFDKDVVYNGTKFAAPDGWQTAEKYEKGIVKIAMAGVSPLKDQNIAMLEFHLKPGNTNVNVSGTFSLNDHNISSLNSVDINDSPVSFRLTNNYPNPFNPSTNIRYSLTENTKVNLVIYNVLGQKIKTLVNSYQQTGNYTVTWDGSDENGSTAGSGLYFCRIIAGNNVKTIKMELLK